ncbi:hypothetical protein [Qipengyuania mesophila]|uniref:hypothetical protein n=1 Tax=Qipengyuania mesophila TaxID=2867246 RepID=UPI0035195E2B
MVLDRDALAQRSMERLAQVVGDITEPVLETYYARHPDARASFEHHGLGHTRELEGRMVAESLYLLLAWVEDPVRARIDHGTAIVHHNDTLLVTPHWYLGLVDATLEILLTTIPAEADDERALWLNVRAEFAAFVESLRSEFIRPSDGRPLPELKASNG